MDCVFVEQNFQQKCTSFRNKLVFILFIGQLNIHYIIYVYNKVTFCRFCLFRKRRRRNILHSSTEMICVLNGICWFLAGSWQLCAAAADGNNERCRVNKCLQPAHFFLFANSQAHIRFQHAYDSVIATYFQLACLFLL